MKTLKSYITEAYTESIFDLINRKAVEVDQNTQLVTFNNNSALFQKWWKAFNEKYNRQPSNPEYPVDGSVVVFANKEKNSKVALVLTKQETAQFQTQFKDVDVVEPTKS